MSFQHKLEELIEAIWSYFIHSTKITSTHMYEVIHCCNIRNNSTLKAFQMVKVYCYINFGIFSHNMLCPIKKDKEANIWKALQDIINENKHKVQNMLLFV